MGRHNSALLISPEPTFLFIKSLFRRSYHMTLLIINASLAPLDMNAKENRPSTYVRSLFPGGKKRVRAPFHPTQPTDEQLDAYSHDLVNAVRRHDIDHLRQLLADGRSFDACNRNGETLLHLACRRGNVETVRFLVREAAVSPNVQDDMGRTVLHDVCWRPAVDTELMEELVRVASPDLLLQEDRRGHTCFDYARQEHWEEWIQFLSQHSDLIKLRSKLMEPGSSSPAIEAECS
jgi:hypothetical protein